MSDFKNKNFYDALGVSRKASTEEIKEAYRELARVYHPDSNFYADIIKDQVSDDSVETFKYLTNAYNTLIHVERRAEYDSTLGSEVADWDAPKTNFHNHVIHKAVQKETPKGFGTFGRRDIEREEAERREEAEEMQKEKEQGVMGKFFGIFKK